MMCFRKQVTCRKLLPNFLTLNGNTLRNYILSIRYWCGVFISEKPEKSENREKSRKSQRTLFTFSIWTKTMCTRLHIIFCPCFLSNSGFILQLVPFM